MDSIYSYLTRFKKMLSAEAGQAVVEYVLILVFVIAVILGGLYQFNSAFKSWANNYFGDYLACLLESGELPSVGGGSSSGECNQIYKPFSLADGRPLVGDALGEGDGSGEDGEDGSGSDGSSGAGGSSNYAEGRARRIPMGSSSSRGGGGGATRFRANSGGEEGDEDGNGLSSGGVADVSGYSQGKVIRIPLRQGGGYRRGFGVDDDKDKKAKPTKASLPERGDVARQGPTLIPINRGVAFDGEAPEIEEFSFGDYFRYLIIAAIIIAIIIFIGGQALQVSKSMD